MNKIKNFIGNSPLLIAILFRKLSDLFISIGFRLHILLKTEKGVKFRQVELETRALIAQINGQVMAQKQGQQVASVPKSSNKLFNAIKGSNEG